MRPVRGAPLRAPLCLLLAAASLLAACSPQGVTPAPATPAPTTPAATATAAASAAGLAAWKPAGMTDVQADRVITLSLEAVAAMGIAAGYEDGYIVALAGGRAYLGNMAASLLGHPEQQWPDLIRDHFAKTFAPPAGSGDPVPSTWQAARLFLRVAVRAPGYFADGAVTKQVAADLVAGLVYDQPSSFVVVPRAIFERWGITEDEAFSTGLANTLAEPGLKVDRDESDSLLYALDSSYSSTYALAIEKLLERPSPNGVLVGIPTRAKLIAVPIRNATVLDALGQYPVTIRADYTAGPYPVSPLLYWWYAGRLTPITDAGGTLVIPDQLRQILDSLKG